MKKHPKMRLKENQATVDLFKELNSTDSKKVSYVYLRDILIRDYQIFNVDDYDNNKYYTDMINHAEKNLKKDGFISVEGKSLEKVYTKENFDIPEPFESIDSANITWDTNQKISNIFEFVNSQEHLIPFFQRGTAWNKTSDYIELAYSIFRSVPLGIMYLWKINKDKVKEIDHNKFKRDISKEDTIQNFEQVNPNEIKSDEIFSVIDGQQRITGINVIINGTFDEKKLYFNERFPGSKKFKFYLPGERMMWTPVEEIYGELLKIKNYKYDLDNEKATEERECLFDNLSRKLFISLESLHSFYNGFFEAELIAICEMPNIPLPEILQVFVRTNQFGKKLNPTDIMMSYIIGQNMKARKQIVSLHEHAKKFKANIKLSTILKLISVMFNNNATIKPSKFFEINKSVKRLGIMDASLSKSWKLIKKAFDELIEITKEGSFNTKWIKSENSIIPIIYWLVYKNKNKQVTDQTVKNNINGYLLIAQISRAFRSSTDQQLNYIITNIKDDFSSWKLNLDKEASIKTIETEISSYKYNVNNNEIKILLMSIGAYFDRSDSIEHIEAQNNGGKDRLNNLAIISKEINSELKDMSISDKVIFLTKRYNISRSDVMKKLILTEDDIRDNKISSKRMQRILDAFSKHLQKSR